LALVFCFCGSLPFCFPFREAGIVHFEGKKDIGLRRGERDMLLLIWVVVSGVKEGDGLRFMC